MFALYCYNSCQVWLCTKKSANTFIAVLHLTIISFSNYQRLVVVFTAALSPTTAIPHYYWHISQIIITLNGELLLRKCNWILAGSYPLLSSFPFDHNYSIGGSNGVNTGWDLHSMQHSLTTATPCKSQKILFKARALGSNLIHMQEIEYISASNIRAALLSYMICFISLLSSHSLWASPPSFARFCDTRISSIL